MASSPPALETVREDAAVSEIAGAFTGVRPPAWRGWAISTVKVAVAAGLLAWLVLSGRLDFTRLLHAAPTWSMAGVAALTLTSMALPAWRWHMLLKAQGLNEPFWRVLRLTWVGYFTALVLPGAAGGDLAKGYFMLRLQPEARVRALSTVLVDRLLGVYSLLLLATLAIGWMFWQGTLPPLVGTIAGTTLSLFLGTTAAAAALWLRPSRRLLLAVFPRTWKQAFAETMDLYQARLRCLFACLLLSVLSNTLAVLSLAGAAECVGSQAPFEAVFLAGPLVVLSNCLPLSPGGIGVAEAASEGLFGAFGVSGGAEMMLLVRITIALLSVPGCFWMTTERPAGRRVRA